MIGLVLELAEDCIHLTTTCVGNTSSYPNSDLWQHDESTLHQSWNKNCMSWVETSKISLQRCDSIFIRDFSKRSAHPNGDLGLDICPSPGPGWDWGKHVVDTVRQTDERTRFRK